MCNLRSTLPDSFHLTLSPSLRMNTSIVFPMTIKKGEELYGTKYVPFMPRHVTWQKGDKQWEVGRYNT